MKKLFLVACVLSFAASAFAEELSVDIHAVSAEGVGAKLGSITVKDVEGGLLLTAALKNIPAGEHGFHVHANPNCGNTAADGSKGAALAAGGHFDPGAKGKHLGPKADGHKGDLPLLIADNNNEINMSVTAPNLKVADIKDRAFMIHAGGDNYADEPAALGGGGARIACGVIK